MSTSFTTGNTYKDGLDHRGWFISHFMPPDQLNHTTAVEIKWDEPKAGTSRLDWSVNQTAHTLMLVIKGSMRVIFPDQSVDLGPGDYAISAPGTSHKYEILTDSITLSLRWPSLPSDHQNK